ncbi:MAG: DUF1450 domain-containing protein [Halorientalis sp.]
MQTVEYCLANVDAETRAALADRDPPAVEKPCLGRCGRCYAGALLVVDGEVRTADAHEPLLEGLE